MIWTAGVNWIVNNIRLCSEHFSRSPAFHANSDLLRATKFPQTWQPNKHFQTLHLSLWLCGPLSLCVCAQKPTLYCNTCLSLVGGGGKYLFLKTETFFSVTQLSRIDMSWLTSHPSFIKPNSPGTFPRSVYTCHFPSTCCRLLVHGCSNYWERAWSL